MNELWLFTFNSFLSIFVIVDPFALVPIYLVMTERFTPAENESTRRKASTIALGTLLVFAISGMAIFNFFGITMPAFQIAGGILLLLMGIEQLHAKPSRVNRAEEDESMHRNDISVFPLATPLLAGPGAISTVVLQGARTADSNLRMVALMLAIFAVLFATYLMLRAAPLLYRVLGHTGLNLMTRIMGLILTAVAVQYIISGLKEVL